MGSTFVAVKETGPKQTVEKFGEVYAFSPNFFAAHRDEPTRIRFGIFGLTTITPSCSSVRTRKS